MTAPTEGPGTGHSGRSWFISVLTVAALVGVVLHFGEVETFLQLLARAHPLWLAVAILLQLSTYVSVASGWSAVLRRAGSPQPFGKLLRIAITKLFADQAVPSAGMGGNVLLVDQLMALGSARAQPSPSFSSR
ncbi:lysylphosphatidylglycerol synthase domain-containing protein [Sphingobium fuliginis]|uniref:lysylphosphatidylglycerol synthase domain-containing protein n=1 Tax=Sphingobium fuliginis (strain ATCC 27551) TaxID=336203 RepID=UPI001ABFE9F8|nr:lysylphosphatidylglycerol synthase domain-containing protein [Sphingobium fuliginis]